MSRHFIRLYHDLEFDEVQHHTLEYGALSGICAKCKAMSIPVDAAVCPGCGTAFKYIAFQNVRDHWPKMARLKAERPALQYVDHQDFKRIESEQRARKILG